MAIKIPKDIDIPIPSVGEPRSLLDTTRQDRINFEGLTADITSVAKSINAHNTAIERERIRNKATKESAKMNLDLQKIIQDIEKGDKNGNPYNEDQIEEIIKFKKKEIDRKYSVESKSLTGVYYNDTQASKDYFESEYWTNLHNFRASSHGIVKDRILADTKLRFEQVKIKHQNKKVIAKDGMWAEGGHWDSERKEITEAWLALRAAGDVTTDLETVQKVVDDKHWRAAVVEEGDYRTDAMGNTVVDNLAIVAKLKSKDEDGSYKEKKFFGKTLNETTRQELITHYQDQAQNQDLTESRHVKRTNDDIVSNAAPEILDNKLDITQIDNLKIVGPDAVAIKTQLKDLRKRVILNQIPKEQDIQTYKHINEGTIDGSISSMYEPFLVQGEEPTKNNPYGWSIIERMKIPDGAKYGAVSDEDGAKWKNFFDQKYSNPFYVKNVRNFNDWFKRYEKPIIGYQQSTMDYITPSATSRYEAVKAKALALYLDGIEKGIKPEDLLDSDSEHYIWKTMGGIKRFIPTSSIEMKEILEYQNIITGKLDADADYQAGGKYGPPPFTPTKYKNHDEYKNSKEYQTWLASEEYKIWKIWFDKQIK